MNAWVFNVSVPTADVMYCLVGPTVLQKGFKGGGLMECSTV
jgi:hypothetical protein